MNRSSFLLLLACVGTLNGLKFKLTSEEALQYLKKITADDYVPVGDVIIHSDMNGTATYEVGFDGTIREIIEASYETVGENEEVLIITTTTIVTGKDEEGDVDTASVVTTKQAQYYAEEDSFWLEEGEGTFFAREPEEDYQVAGSIVIKGSGHEDQDLDNTSTVLIEEFEIDRDEEGEETSLLYADYDLAYLEDRLEIKGFETIKVEPNEFKEFPVQVNSVEITQPPPGEKGKVTSDAAGTLFEDKDNDNTYTSEAEGFEWYTEELKLKRPPITGLFRRRVRSRLAHIHKRK